MVENNNRNNNSLIYFLSLICKYVCIYGILLFTTGILWYNTCNESLRCFSMISTSQNTMIAGIVFIFIGFLSFLLMVIFAYRDL